MNSSTIADQMIKFDAKNEAIFHKFLRILKFKHRQSIMIAQLKKDLDNRQLLMQKQQKIKAQFEE
jgi:hypothetical protein